MIVQVDHAGVDCAPGFDHHCVFGRIGKRFTRLGDRHDLAAGQPHAGVWQNITRVIHRYHFTDENHSGVWLPLRRCSAAE